MKKDTTATVRINSKIKERLKLKGVTAQKIIDAYIDENVIVSEEIKLKD